MPEHLQEFIVRSCFEKFNINVESNKNLTNDIGEFRLVEINDLRLTILDMMNKNDISYYCKIDFDESRNCFTIDYISQQRKSIYYTREQNTIY